MKKKQSPALLVGVIGLVALVAIWAAYTYLAPSLIKSMYLGESTDFLNGLIGGRNKYSLEYYLGRGHKAFAQMFALAIIAYVLILGSVMPQRYTQRAWQWFKDFLTTPYYPVSLAVFRISFFALMVWFAWDWATGPEDAANIIWWSRFPKELQFPPFGLAPLLKVLPINPQLASITSILFLIFCFTAMIGLFSRSSAFLSVVFGLYVLGIPQFYGKVHHYQHLIWFATLLALSPCGDMLSVDAIFRSWRRADKGETAPPGASSVYGLPLRLTWILIGILYFFPGYWKWWESGLEWALSDNLKMQMFKKWFEIGNWEPLIHVENYPFMYQSAALITLIFEMGFIFFIFIPKIRWLAIATGQMFHTMTLILMRIPFIDLQICYVVFFEWQRIFEKLGDWFINEPLTVVYDGSSVLSRRAIASVRTLDVLGRITYLDSQDKQALAAHSQMDLSAKSLQKGLHAYSASGQWVGFAAYQQVVRRVPLLWLLRLPPVAALIRPLYERMTKAKQMTASKYPEQPSNRWSMRAVATAGTVLVVVNIILGFAHIDSWPFSVYPTFQAIQDHTLESLIIKVETVDNKEVWIDNELILENFTPDRFFPLIYHIYKKSNATGDLARRDEQLKAVWHVIEQSNPELNALHAETVSFYRVVYTVMPGEEDQNPLERTLLSEVDVASHETNVSDN